MGQSLSEFAETHNVAIIATTHLNKSAGSGPALSRTLGSVAFQNLARLSCLVVPDKSDEHVKLVLPTKSNLGARPKGFKCRITADPADPDIPKFELLGETDIEADEALDSYEGTDRDKRENPLDEAIQTVLADGTPVNFQTAVEEIQRIHGNIVSPKTIQRSAKRLGVQMTRIDFGGKGVWILPRDPNT